MSYHAVSHFDDLFKTLVIKFRSEPILKVQLTVESKLALTMRFGNSRKVTCDADLALQDERWYHATVSVPPSNPMAVFVNGVQIKYYCVENVSAATRTLLSLNIFLPQCMFSAKLGHDLTSSDVL